MKRPQLIVSVALCTLIAACGGEADPPAEAAAPDAAPSARALAAPQAAAAVCLYEHINYQGASVCTGANSSWVGQAWNDRISSVRVPAGWQVQLFADTRYGGRSLTLTADNSNLAGNGFNDTASSFKLTTGGGAVDLNDPRLKDIAMQLVSSAENSSLDWRAQFGYIEDIGDGRGYTAGIIGFCSGTGDMLELVQAYTQRASGNRLARYLPALRQVNGSDSHAGLDPTYTADWRAAANDPVFRQTQEDERDRAYFNPAVQQAKADGLRALGQFIYYDAIVMHGPGDSSDSFGGIRAAALARAQPPSQGGDETAYLNAFLDVRVAVMSLEAAHSDTSRVDTAQRVFLQNANLDLKTPLAWHVYGDSYQIP
jgi:chitosanase